jgi:alkanesulfonate monooxygenase SsuD/methylene tetrahydromethanopterin reductase-like flavin-dependent oxidoreductase (luciferase family)
MELSKLGVWYFFDGMPAAVAAEAAQRIEALNYGTLWIPETTGRNPMVFASWLLANTQTLHVATGIANIYHREPGVTVGAQKALAEQSENRFLLGLGVSHKPFVEGVRGLQYRPPVATMAEYLTKMAQAPYQGVPPSEEPATVIAALDKLLCVEQKVIMETNASRARELARTAASMYMQLPNYRNNWLRMGMSESDVEGAGSDRFIDATFAWGNKTQIQARIQEHLDAGADQVCIQPINPNGQFGDLHWETLEALAP